MLAVRLSQDREGVGDQLGPMGDVISLAVAVLPDSPGDMHQVALAGRVQLFHSVSVFQSSPSRGRYIERAQIYAKRLGVAG